ncbi:MAG TPA: cytochrome c oxidase subunit 3 [Terriglobales bacterium]|nr:cytochrome c oxidase subunit 3 [Terriglobales bacterium]
MLRRYRLALALWLCSIGMVFVAFSSAYVVRRGVPTYETETGAYSTHWDTLHIPVPLLLINSLLLAGAAVAMEVARRRSQAAAHESQDRTGSSWIWTGASSLLVLGFLVGQALVWNALSRNGESMASGARAAFFYLLTGAHALNVALGLIAVIYTVIRGRHWSMNKRYVATDLSAWYMHAMTLLWIYLLGFLLFA